MDQLTSATPQATAETERWSDAGSYRAAVGRSSIRSILVIKVDHIGDFILSLDAVMALREAFADARIDLVCAPWNEALAHSLGLFGRIHTVALFSKRADSEQPSFHPDMLASLRGESYDLAIDLRIDPDSRILLRHVMATYRVGFDSPDHRAVMTMFLPHYLPAESDTNVGMHQSMLMLRLARSTADLFNRSDTVKALLLGRVAQPADIDLTIARDRILVACNTSSGRAVKNWPAERFRRVIRWLANDLDAVVLLLGGPEQLAETADVIQFCGSSNVLSAVAKTSIGQAVRLVAQASLFLGNDSGLTHVAARLGVPTVALFSGVDPTVMWAPLGEHVTVLRAPVPCSPCHIAVFRDCHNDHACMRNISEAAVRSAVRRHLYAARRYGQPNTPMSASIQDVRQHPMFRGWVTSQQPQRPQRFDVNYPRYIAQGGQLPVAELIEAFTTNNENNRGDLNRFYMFMLLFDQIIKEQISGDIAELGVYKGNTAALLAALARHTGATAYLLDTFAGFAASDLDGVDANKRMEFADTSLQQVQALVGTTATCYVKGYFPDTANQIPDNARFCLVHIDCDLYAPFKHALNFFYDRLVPGGFLVMHDYSSLHWDGAERAVDEFFADKPEAVVPMPDGSGTVVVRKAGRPDRLANWFVQRRSTGFAHAWVHANSPSVSDFLASGWASPEPWGTWGLGAAHVLVLVLTQAPRGDVELAVESTAALIPGRSQQSVAVIVAGATLATWHYSEAHNTAVRLVTIPHAAFGVEDGLPVVRVEFRPESTQSPHALDPAHADDRPLGLGLIRFRQRHL